MISHLTIMLLIALNAVPLVVSEKFNEYNYYGTLIKNVRDKYMSRGVTIAWDTSYESFDHITIWYGIAKKLFNDGISTAFLNFNQIESQLKVYLEMANNAPLIVIILNNIGALDRFKSITDGLDPAKFVWLILFNTDSGQEVCDSCRHPRENLFNLKFNSQVVVSCCDSRILQEWWCIEKNHTESQEIGRLINSNEEITWFSDKLKRDRRNSLGGRALRIGAIKGSYFYLDKNEQYSGYLGELLRLMSEAMNFTVSQIIWDKNYGYWDSTNSTWTGLIGRVSRHEVDIGFTDFLMLSRRYNAIDFTRPIVTGTFNVYFKKQEEANIRWNAYFKVLAVEVWIVIIGFILVTPILLTLIEYKRRKCPLLSLLFEYYLCVWSLFCHGTPTDCSRATPTRIIYLSISLAALVVYNAYAALMTSSLAVSSSFRPFETLEEFVADGTYQLIVVKNSLHYQLFKSSDEPLTKQMMSLMKPEHLLPETAEEGFEQANKNNKLVDIFLAVTSHVNAKLCLFNNEVCRGSVGFYVNEFTKKMSEDLIPCEIISIRNQKKEPSALIVPKGSELLDRLNYHIQQFMDSGMLQQLMQKYDRTRKPDEESVSSVTPVHLHKFAPIIYVSLIGVVIALIFFIIERNSYISMKKKRNRKQ